MIQWSRHEQKVVHTSTDNGDGWYQSSIEWTFPISYNIAFMFISSVVNGGTSSQWVSFTTSNMLWTNSGSSLIHSIYLPNNELSITYTSIGQV